MLDEKIKTRILIEVIAGLGFIFFTYTQSVTHSNLIEGVLGIPFDASVDARVFRLIFIYLLMLLAGLILLGLSIYESYPDQRFVIITAAIFLGALLIVLIEVSSYQLF